MKRTRRKSDHCLNCGERIDKDFNFCPNCGQENTDNYVTTRTLIGEFLNNYFSFDSRFIRTFGPFLFKPGKITQVFLDGKRLLYANPVRWYLVISLFHFLMLNQFEGVNDSIKNSDGIVNFGDGDTDFGKDEIDSLLKVPDSLKYEYDENDIQLNNYEFALIEAMAQADTFSNNQIYDSLNIDQKPFFTKIVSTIIIKSVNSSQGAVNAYILEQVPLIVFFILPLYALILKIFYYRKGYYIMHLIHSLHIHSFLFFILGIGWAYCWLIAEVPDTVAIIGFTLASVYIIFSSRRLYQQGVGLIILKTLSIGFLYILLVSFVFLIGILLSVLLM
jgi:predicted RNA-binding Zn-ribbon protein involved in translation (DUF1610 family)